MKKYIAIRELILISIILSPFNLASAAGFAVMEQSVTGLGNAFAGGSAAATDSSTVFYNPAGMSKLPGTQSAAGLHYIMPKAEFSDSGSVITNPVTGQTSPTPGTLHDNGGEEAIVTNFYLTSQVTDSVHLGLGINAPFGLATKYHDDWVGRYHAITSAMQTVNINPSVAFSFLDGRFSVGVGFNAQYVHLRLTSAVDYGTICAGSAAAASCGSLGLIPQSPDSDGIAKVNGDSWGYGGNVGLLYEPVPGTRVGLAYRSHMRHTIRGETRFDNKPAGAQRLFSSPTSPFQTTTTKGNVDLPETISFSLFHKINEQWAVMGDISWTNWDRFEELIIDFDNPSQPATEIEEKWDDVFRYALGIAYTPSSQWTFRAGTAYEETPIASADFRTPRIPDNNRYWLSVGASYSPLDQLTIDFAYTHIFMHNSEINNTDALGHTLKGTFSTDADIVSAQARWVF